MLVLFPQWQGSTHRALQPAARLLHSHFVEKFVSPSSPVKHIEVPLVSCARNCDASIEMVAGIHARHPILTQLIDARDLIGKNFKSPDFVAVIGGDCGVEVPAISVLNCKHAHNLAIIWFDAHGDLNTPESSPSGCFHGMPLRLLLGEGDEDFVKELIKLPLTPNQIFMAGVRDLDTPEKIYIQHHNVAQFSATQANKLLQSLQKSSLENIYIHLDLDVLDPSAFCHTDFRVPGGLTVEDITTFIDILSKNLHVVGMGITEYNGQSMSDLEAIHPILQRLRNLLCIE